MNTRLAERPEAAAPIRMAERILHPVLNTQELNAAKIFPGEALAERASKMTSTLERFLHFPIGRGDWGLNE
jgi:hypothetical protein